MKSRGIKGSALAEFAPVLFVFFVVVFFPMVDLLSIGMKYCVLWIYNFYETRELSMQPLVPPGGISLSTEYTNVHKQQLTNWQKTGWYQFLGDTNFDSAWTPPTPAVDATLSDPVHGTSVSFITNSTNGNLTPLVMVPFLSGVPGLGAPVPMTISTTKECEYH